MSDVEIDEPDDEPWEDLTPRRPGTPVHPAGVHQASATPEKPSPGDGHGDRQGDDESRPAPTVPSPPEAAAGAHADEDDSVEEFSPLRPGAPEARGADRLEQPAPQARLVRCTGCGRKVPRTSDRCPVCSAPVASAAPTPDSGATAVLRFSGGAVQVHLRPGDVRALGRDPVWAPTTAGGFADERSVSRRHAEVTLRSDGTLWVTEHQNGTTHGTRVNGEYLLPAVPRPLVDGDRLVLGLDSEATVSLCAPREEPTDPEA
ncbi:FHA domain-containing protein [Streptomyces panaciradicis]|uniref:FHA domain-containing protein n=1 Tax=Streptomyces panaciradicis TaxID=1470261 RepID=UPI00201D2192|nr:FHA domain-containing protein [Streptomyces panaciradicis]MCL6671547.1 FHA domain-containing protein [Streptomyces panaciradicis]